MVERRDVLGSGLLAGLAGTFAPVSAAEPAAAAEDTSEAAANAIDRLRTSLDRDGAPGVVRPAIGAIRQQQRTFIRSHDKYPDYIEVGLSVREDVYDWHVRF